ncbi:sodium/sugar symporter [Pseudoxanthomonas sp. X-1]|uniref:sodium/sugar symporter n=1 Tax=Pseudoxanthomonas sp. X-1 TaxID=2571115 RepID=UPI00110B4389|nr:sodium/sugar symporter [Pseudoxanthomonas sp. X-1]TMN20237.1 sodium/solute symporter [Pseudoxanthomonas sp. X-1]UAY73574.1 sodium/sugar symporter [Pseudoxanthomonas sp. X-1]
MRLSPLDTCIVVLYAIFIFALAQWVSREKRGGQRSAQDYFLASRALPWWAIGTSLIAANISAEQIIGMSGSGYVIGLGIASYEWMAALTLIIVGKFFLPIFLKNGIYTMPEFLEKRYSPTVRTVMALFWLGVYVFVNLTSILWLGATAVHTVAGVDVDVALVALGLFAGAYALYGGLKAVALTDFVQVSLLVLGGLLITWIALDKVADGAGVVAGFQVLLQRAPEKFHMILDRSNPHYKDLPGLSVLLGGMWVMNVSYWGFNQYIIQRALAAKSLGEAQKGIVLAAFLKLMMPLIIVVPGIAAVLLAPGLERPDAAYPHLMSLLPNGILGVVFAALMAAVIASLGSKINSIATIFTMDVYRPLRRGASEKQLVRVGRIAAALALVLAIFSARPLLGSFDQAFQYIQEFTGFFTPGICVIFLLGMFWKRTTATAALVAAVASAVLSLALKLWLPSVAFMDRVGLVFLACIALAVVISLVQRGGQSRYNVELDDIDYTTSKGFNLAALLVVVILISLYAVFW